MNRGVTVLRPGGVRTRHVIAAALVLLSLCARGGERADVISEDTQRFTALLDSRLPARRIEGIQGLSHLKHWPAEDALIRLLKDSQFAVRREAVKALCRLGTENSVPTLIQLLDDPSWELREHAALGLQRMTAEDVSTNARQDWEKWWNGTTLTEKRRALLEVASAVHTNAPAGAPRLELRRGKRVPARAASAAPASCPDRRQALRALRHLAGRGDEAALIDLLARPQIPPLDPDERAFVCEALERVGTTNSIRVLSSQGIEAAAWALGKIGGPDAEQALRKFPPTLPMFLGLDRLHSTNAAPWIPLLVSQMAQITYRSHPDDVMNDELQPIQRVGANLIRRSGLAPTLIECVLQELESTMKPPIAHGPRPAHPPQWSEMFQRMHSELKPGFVREDGATTSQPIVAMCYLMDTHDAVVAQRLLRLLHHPAIVSRVYVALALGRMQAREALPALTKIIEEGYAFSDSTALASGKHFDQSQTVRWRGFLCMALGRMGGDDARLALQRFAADPSQPRDVRYSSVVGLRFIGSTQSLPVLSQVAEQDLIWMVRNEARLAAEQIEILNGESRPVAEVHQ